MRLLLTALLFSLISCQLSPSHQTSVKTPKNIILLIGDGMGPQQVSSLYYLAKYGSEDPVSFENLSFQRLAEKGNMTISATDPINKIVVDSACSATQLALGEQTFPEFIGVDKKGNDGATILEKAKGKGLATGVVSDTRITHATPASFAAHASNRFLENEIAVSLLEVEADLMYSGGARNFIPSGKTVELAPSFTSRSKRKDQRDLLQEAKEKGYALVHNKKQMIENRRSKVLGLFAEKNMPTSIWQNQNISNKQRTVPNLTEMTASALDLLSQNKNGFFLMVEGGQIDWAGHANDAGWLFHEMVNFNHTLNFLIDWVEKNPDTLLVVTADHETGGFGFSYNLSEIPKPVDFSGTHFKDDKRQESFNYVSGHVIDKIYRQKRSIEEVAKEFNDLPETQKDSLTLQKLVEKTVDFKFDSAAAKRTLRKTKNKYQYPWLKHTLEERLPFVPHTQAFYVSPLAALTGLISKELATQQNVAWATGTHTATPVYVFSYGPGQNQFHGYLHHKDVGQKMQDLLNL